MTWLIQSESCRQRVFRKVLDQDICTCANFIRIGEIKRELSTFSLNRNQTKYITLLLSAYCGSQMDNQELFSTLIEYKEELWNDYGVKLSVTGEMKLFQLCVFAMIYYKNQSNAEAWLYFVQEVATILPRELNQLLSNIPTGFFQDEPEEDNIFSVSFCSGKIAV